MKAIFKIRMSVAAPIIFVFGLFTSCAEQAQFYTNNLRTDAFVQNYAIQAYDFLWVLDNSPSMDPKRAYLAANMQTFLNTLNSRKAIDYQMAVTNVDYFTNNGTLVQNSNGLSVVKSATSTNPASDFASIVNSITDTATSFWEQGMIQSYLVIQNYGPQFMRAIAPLIVIYITDDDDWSCQGMLDGTSTCYGVQPENNPNVKIYDTSFFINYFKTLKSAQGSSVTLFPVVGTTNATCTVERVGMRYQEIANQVGGGTVTGGLCPDSIGNSLSNIAMTIANRGVTFPLSAPSDGQNLSVYVNGVLVPYSDSNGYTFDASSNSIIFSGSAIPNNGDSVNVLYDQMHN